ncbi:MAG: CDP-alcohol phosphatidyltransferase family protein [Firmicutes bacterium]|nr:CDP-alcohol phosphatidyltransferase family protein [Bacillota bacterium]
MSQNKIDFSPFAPKKNFSIPNLISLFRLLMIPFILWAYANGRATLAVSLIILSGISDGVDGFIARRFNQITELGKLLDPFADKLTQIAVAIILCYSFTSVIPLVVILVVKELLMLLLGLRMMKNGAKVISAKWWGKVSTTAFYLGVAIVMLFSEKLGEIGIAIISILISLLMLFSLIQYWREFQRLSRQALAAQK